MLSTLCLLFVPEEEELYRLETLVVIVIFTVLWNNIIMLMFSRFNFVSFYRYKLV